MNLEKERPANFPIPSVLLCRECYLRFCSQQFDLTNNNEAVHLSNNAIQCKYLNGERSGELPEENMWDVHQFKDYLRWVPASRRKRKRATEESEKEGGEKRGGSREREGEEKEEE